MSSFILFFMLWLGPLPFKSAGNALVVSAGIQSMLGIYQFLTQSTFAFKWLGLVEHHAWLAGTSIISSPDVGRWLRAYGAFPHPNVFGGFLAITITITGFLLLKKTTRGLWYYLVLMLQLTALFFTFSRSAWIAVAIGLVLFSFLEFKKRKTSLEKKYLLLPLGCVILMLAILSTIFWPLVQTRFSNQSVNEVRSTTERVSGYKEAISVWKQNSLLGVGAGNYTRALIENSDSFAGYTYQPVHNTSLLALVELGVLGSTLLVILTITLILYLHAQKILLRNKLLVMLVVYIVLTTFDHYLYSSFVGLLMGKSFIALMLRKE